MRKKKSEIINYDQTSCLPLWKINVDFFVHKERLIKCISLVELHPDICGVRQSISLLRPILPASYFSRFRIFSTEKRPLRQGEPFQSFHFHPTANATLQILIWMIEITEWRYVISLLFCCDCFLLSNVEYISNVNLLNVSFILGFVVHTGWRLFS